MRKRPSRFWLSLAAALAVAGALVWAFWPRPLAVDLGEVTRGPMIATIDEEGRTQVREVYTVSTPVAGVPLRIEVEPGDRVEGGRTAVASMLPSNPSVLDVRAREQARTAVVAAEAAVRLARADFSQAEADKDLADHDLERKRELRRAGAASQAALELAERAWHQANASLERASAAIAMRRADLENASARLTAFEVVSHRPDGSEGGWEDIIPLKAPISGRMLRVLQRARWLFRRASRFWRSAISSTISRSGRSCCPPMPCGSPSATGSSSRIGAERRCLTGSWSASIPGGHEVLGARRVGATGQGHDRVHRSAGAVDESGSRIPGRDPHRALGRPGGADRSVERAVPPRRRLGGVRGYRRPGRPRDSRNRPG